VSAAKRRGDREGTFAGNTPGRAIIDIGSNTVRMVIYGGTMRAPTVLLNEKVTAKLGRDIASKGMLAEEAIELAMRGLRRFALLLRDLEVEDVETVATAAVREASNGSKFIAQLKKLGFKPKIITGEEEACLSANGVMGAFPGARGTVADLGGGSLELIRLTGKGPKDAVSLPLGTLRLPDFRGESRDAMRKAIERALKKGAPEIAKGAPLYLVGGTLRTMAVYAMQEERNPLSDPHGFELSPDEAKRFLGKALAKETMETLRARDRISTMRAEKLPDASVLAEAMLSRFEPSRIIFSSWGLREGLLYSSLPDHSKSRDPLLAGVSVFAAQRGAPATLASRIAAWTVDAAPSLNHGSERLRMASIMLALASMQIEPNIRLPQATDWALHKRWIALRSKERAMIAAAIEANGNAFNLSDGVMGLACKEALDEAVCWGLAVRLARRLGASSRRSLQESRLTLQDGVLTLKLADSQGALFGFSTEKDMKLLAGHLGRDWKVEVVSDDELRKPNSD